ncbi:MAG: porin [Bacteroidales bacterium]
MQKYFFFLCLGVLQSLTISAQQENSLIETIKQSLENGVEINTPQNKASVNLLDSMYEIAEVLNNLPNIEIGKGISFQPANNSYKMTLRFRMQNMVGFYSNNDFSQTDIEARVKRLRLRLDGYIYSPQLAYSIQLGFTPYDAAELPNGNVNIVRDAMVYYIPNSTWNVGFGQTKIRANRARVNSSSALQFIDRSIVNSEFNIDRDFGLFGEYHKTLFADFNLSTKGSITLGEGRNYTKSKNSGLCYTSRLELFPLGRFKALGDVIEGDFEREENLKILFAGTYSFNDRTLRSKGTRGELFTNNETRSLHTYFVDFIMKYQGWAFYADYMRRYCNRAQYTGGYIYNGDGLNLQTSYLLKRNWEFAIRNSMLIPHNNIKESVQYLQRHQSTFGITKYIIGHSLKLQADISYNHYASAKFLSPTCWEFRAQIELGL